MAGAGRTPSTVGYDDDFGELGDVADLSEQLWLPAEAGALQPVDGPDRPRVRDAATLSTVSMGPGGTRPLDVPGRETTGTIRVRTSRVRQPGEAISGHSHYEIEELIGTGASAEVYRAKQASCDRLVALKVLKKNLRGRQGAQDALLYEAVVAGNLDHPHVIPIYDVGFTDRGLPFCAMKLATGPTWGAVMEQMGEAENLRVIRAVARALQYAHSRGVLHRDVKPDNVMLGEFGEVQLGDWGLAIGLHPQAKAIPLASCEPVGGTPGFMAPEMASGAIDSIDERSDVYLLCGLVFHLVTGRPPHPGEDNRISLTNAACNVIAETPVRGPLLDLALRGLATLPSERYADVADFLAALDAYDGQRESLALADRAQGELAEAERDQNAHAYARVVFTCEEALRRWPGNERARETDHAARLAYARKAFAGGDFDLADALLDHDELRSHPLRYAVADERHQRRQVERSQAELGDQLVGLLRSLGETGTGQDLDEIQHRCRALLRRFGHGDQDP